MSVVAFHLFLFFFLLFDSGKELIGVFFLLIVLRMKYNIFILLSLLPLCSLHNPPPPVSCLSDKTQSLYLIVPFTLSNHLLQNPPPLPFLFSSTISTTPITTQHSPTPFPQKHTKIMRDHILPTIILIALFPLISTILTSPRGLEYVTKGFSLVVMACLVVLVWIQWRAIEVVVAEDEG